LQQGEIGLADGEHARRMADVWSVMQPARQPQLPAATYRPC